jgi:methyltransferase (TIGR00027 family)
MDETSAASRTAMMVAGLRAMATARDAPICSDPWALQLAGPEGMRIAEESMTYNPNFELWLALRTAWIDDAVVRHAGPDGSMDQVVLLGAGLDSRAARFARPGLRFFEVDHPQTQAEKRTRLEALDGYPVDDIVFVTCDFGREGFLDRLVAEGFAVDQPALFVWEGVVPYLDDESVRATLTTVAQGCHADSVILFDYIMKKMAQGQRLDGEDAAMRQLVGGMGEPLRYGFNDATPMMFGAGFRHVRTVSFDEIALSMTGTYERARKFRFQGLVIASRGRSLTP